MCFINGLGNKHYTKILNQIKPTSLKAALDLIKKEKECSDDLKCNFIGKEQSCGNNYQAQIETLQSKVSFLEKQREEFLIVFLHKIAVTYNATIVKAWDTLNGIVVAVQFVNIVDYLATSLKIVAKRVPMQHVNLSETLSLHL